MINNIVIAVAGGLVGTSVMTGMMLVGKQLKLPAVDAHGILGYVQYADRPTALGYVMHWMMGAVFAVGYALAFLFIPGDVFLLSVVLGVVHWLIVGWMFAFAPRVHAGMKAGTVDKTGPYMWQSLGVFGFIAGMLGHIVFGGVVALIYMWLGGSFAV